MIEDVQRLYDQGRAKSPTELWLPEEWDAVIELSTKRSLTRQAAGEHVRKGIRTVEDYDKATKKSAPAVDEKNQRDEKAKPKK